MAQSHHEVGPSLGRVAMLPIVRRIRRRVVRAGAFDGMMLALGAGVGFVTGILAVALIALVSVMQRLAFGESPGPLTIVAVTTAGGLLVGVLVTYVVPEARGGGVTDVMESIALHGGRMRAAVVPGKLLASGLSLGAGASGGREAPIVQIGGGVGSTLGRVFALTEERKRELIAAGAAAGIAASFNAPIGGMLFAIEVIIGGFRLRYLQVIVVASVVASVTARELIGPALIYSPPPYRLGEPQELLLYVVVGVAAAGVGLALARGEHFASRMAERLPVWVPARTAIGGLVVGGIALAIPEVLGTGDNLPPVPGAVHEPIGHMLSGTFAAQFELAGMIGAGLMLLVLVAKLVATLVSIGSGFSVGSFGPAFFLGAALGGAIGHAATVLAPGAGIRPGALAVAGMAAVLGAAAHAPLTGIIIAFELTGDYGMVLPLMLATGIATFIADRVSADSMYTLGLRRRGIVYGEPEDVDIMQTVRVGEIMTREPETVPEDLPVTDLHRHFRRSGPHGFPVVAGDDPTRLVGVVTVSDLARAVGETTGDLMSRTDNARGLTAGDICTRQPLTITPDDPVFRALQRMGFKDVGRLPVVDPQDHRHLVGMVRRADIVTAYQKALTRGVEDQQRTAVGQLRDLFDNRFLELVVHDDAPVAGQEIRDVDWPPRTMVVSVRRGASVLTPGGGTRINAGDVLLVLTNIEQAERVRNLLSAHPTGQASP